MTNDKMTSRVEDGKILVLERVFDAPPELVFKAYKDPAELKHWWGPRGWELPVCKMDFRQGGVWHYCMKCMDASQGDYYGMESWGKAVFQEIHEPRQIVYVDYFADAEGRANEAMPSTRVHLDFVNMDGRTKLVSRGEYVSPEALKTVLDMGMLAGIGETWDRLEERLAVVTKKG